MDRLAAPRAACIALAIAALSGCSIARQAKPEVEPSGLVLPPAPSVAEVEVPTDPPAADTSPVTESARKPQVGNASFYANRFHGRKTASGRRYRKEAYTAAHRTLPLGTRVKVTNTRNDRSVVVEINDRGPYARRRIIDLSRAAARKIGMIRSGIAPVRVEVVQNEAETSSKLQLASSEP